MGIRSTGVRTSVRALFLALRLGVGVYVLGLLVTLGSILLTPLCRDLLRDTPFDLAVVLSAGVTSEGLGPMSRARTQAGIDLYHRGLVNALHMTGSAHPDPQISAGAQMAQMAVRAGLPPASVSAERLSQSTLENALFSTPWTKDRGEILLVTSGFHMWRGVFSMAWAGTPPAATCQSSAFDRPFGARAIQDALSEGLKWPGNLARAAVWSGAGRLGVRQHLPDWFLS